MFNRATLEKYLQQAEKHVMDGDRHVARQRELISRMERHGHDTAQARRLLKEFEELQAMHLADRERLRQEKAELDQNLS